MLASVSVGASVACGSVWAGAEPGKPAQASIPINVPIKMELMSKCLVFFFIVFTTFL
jgi:hypothetical protein